MKSSICDEVAARVAVGEPLGDAAEHAATCPRCRAIAALPVQLGELHAEAEPAPGFTARMTAGAQRRVARRRQVRVAAGAAVVAATVALAVFSVSRRGAEPAPGPALAMHTPSPAVQPHPDTPPEPHPRAIDPDVKALVQLADTHRALRASADWADLERPLVPYRAVLEGRIR